MARRDFGGVERRQADVARRLDLSRTTAMR